MLFNSAKMLKMGVLVVFMHDYGHQEALIDIITLVLCQGVPVGPSVAIWGCLWGGVGGCFFNPPYGLITADLKNGQLESILKIISSLKIITSWLERWAPFLMGHLTEDPCRFIRD